MDQINDVLNTIARIRATLGALQVSGEEAITAFAITFSDLNRMQKMIEKIAQETNKEVSKS